MAALPLQIVPFEPDHGREIQLQRAQLGARQQLDGAETLAALEREESFTVIGADGAVLACAGLIDLGGWDGQRKFAWALLAERPGGSVLLAITRAISRHLQACPARRIETSVDCNFAAGIVWAARLGFACEGRMRGYGFDGADHYLFARVRAG